MRQTEREREQSACKGGQKKKKKNRYQHCRNDLCMSENNTSLNKSSRERDRKRERARKREREREKETNMAHAGRQNGIKKKIGKVLDPIRVFLLN